MNKEENQIWKEITEKDHIQYKRNFSTHSKELMVGASDRKYVDYIAFRWFDFEARLILQQFFFENDKFVGFRIRAESDYDEEFKRHIYDNYFENLPENRPPMHEEYRLYFEELGNQVQSLKNSLEKCVEIIAAAGPKYKKSENIKIHLEV